MSFGKNKEKLILFACVFIFVFILTSLTPFAGDDFIYFFNDESSRTRPQSLADVYNNMIAQRYFVSARVVNHFVFQSLLMLPKWVFNCLNAIIAVLFAKGMMCFSETEDRKKSLVLLLSGMALVWCLMPVFGQVFFWTDGACNYGWTLTLMLACLLPYYRLLTNRYKRYSPLILGLWLIGCLLFGACSETGSAASIGMAFLFMLHSFLKDKKLHAELIGGFLLMILGYAFLVTSPTLWNNKLGGGSSVVSRIFSIVSPWLLLPAGVILVVFFIFMVKGRLTGVLLGIIGCGWLAAFLLLMPDGGLADIISCWYLNMLTMFAVCAAVFVLGFKNRISRSKLTAAAIFTLGGLVSLVPCAFAIYFAARQACFCILLMTLSVIIIASELNWKLPLKISFFVLMAAFVAALIIGVTDIVNIHHQSTENLARIAAAKSDGSDHVTLKMYDCKSKYSAVYYLEDIGENPEDCWVNRYMADYYDIGFIFGEK